MNNFLQVVFFKRINDYKHTNTNFMNIDFRKFFIFGALLIFSQFFISDAYAYLDPGSLSVFFQAMLGVLVGVAITLKIYWYKIKEKIMKKS